jgi:hypothetical protein
MRIHWAATLTWLTLLLPSIGCVSVTTGGLGVGGGAMEGLGFPATGPSCSDGSCSSSMQGFYAGPGPLSRFFGVASCGAGGCGERYVDEWISEPPVEDCCGTGYGGIGSVNPIHSLVAMIRSRQYRGSCHACTESSQGCSDCGNGCSDCGMPNGSEIHSTGSVIHQGMAGASGHASSGCNCNKGSTGHNRSMPGAVTPSQPVESVDPSAIYGPSSNGQQRSGGAASGKPSSPTAPTPAPSLTPSSANRLNPALRRAVR